MTIPAYDSFAPLAERYDAFILDLWGVVHDGKTAYAGAKQTLENIRAMGKPTLLLSNAPRRSYALVAGMEKMGLPRDLYTHIFSSGEAVNMELRSRTDPFFAALGQAVYFLGPDRDHNLLDDVDATVTDDPEGADWVINSGPVELTETLDDYREVLEALAARNLPMVCANPDHVVIRDNQRVMCAGELAAHYESLGPQVAYRGKPDPAVYALALEKLGVTDKSKILVVGDAMETDVRGATGAGLDSAFVTGGIHAEDLGTSYGVPADPDKVAALAERFGYSPVAALPAFVW